MLRGSSQYSSVRYLGIEQECRRARLQKTLSSEALDDKVTSTCLLAVQGAPGLDGLLRQIACQIDAVFAQESFGAVQVTSTCLLAAPRAPGLDGLLRWLGCQIAGVLLRSPVERFRSSQLAPGRSEGSRAWGSWVWGKPGTPAFY